MKSLMEWWKAENKIIQIRTRQNIRKFIKDTNCGAKIVTEHPE